MLIEVKVIPKSSHSRIEKTGANTYKVNIKSAPEKGKANKELLKLLSDYFSISKSKINIKKGQTSRNKLIQIH